MMASRSSNSLRVSVLLLTAFSTILIVSISLPESCLAKTRPPVEAGDPDIGNEKPRGSGRVEMVTTRDKEHYMVVREGMKLPSWYRMILSARLGLFSFYRAF